MQSQGTPDFKDVPIDQIEIGTEQVRHRINEESIDELAESIKKLSLLNPITVVGPDSKGKYKLIAGQRRLLACTKLGWKNIPARVVTSMDEYIAKASSFAENELREDLSQADTRNTVVWLYARAGSAKAVADALGIPIHIVREYVKYEELDQGLKEMVDKKQVTVKDAVRAQEASYNQNGSVDPEKAKAIAKEMQALLGVQKQALVKKAQEMPAASADQLLEEARKPQNVKDIRIRLYAKEYDGLKQAAEQLDKTEEETAVEAVTSWLKDQGYT